MSIWVKNLQICRLGQKFPTKIWPNLSKILILVKIIENFEFGYENLDFGQSLWKFWFRPKLSENLDLGQHFRKISILVNILGKIDLGHFPQILVLVKISEKMSIGVKICKHVDFGKNYKKISIFVKIFGNIAFGENCRKISNVVKFVEIFQFWSKLSKILDFGHKLEKCRFW